MLACDVQYLATDTDDTVVASDGGRRLARLTDGWLIDIAVLPRDARVTGLSTLPDGGIAIADSGWNRIWRLDESSRVHAFAGVEQPPGLDRRPKRRDGPVDVAMFRAPQAIGLDPSGAVFIADWDGPRSVVRRIADGSVTTIEPRGLPPARLTAMTSLGPNRIVSLAAGGPPALFVMKHDQEAWRLDSVVGSVDEPGQADGIAALARFVAPTALTTWEKGCTIADGARLRYLDDDLVVSTLAGAEPGFVDGTGLEARFGRIGALASKRDGTRIVSDPENDAVRVVSLDGTVTTRIGSLREGRVSTGESATLSRAFGKALIDDDLREAWGLARVFLRDHRLGAEPWPDRTIQPTSVASARLGKGLSETWSRSQDPERSSVGVYCLWLIGCEERAMGVNEIRDHRLRKMGDDLDRRAG